MTALIVTTLILVLLLLLLLLPARLRAYFRYETDDTEAELILRYGFIKCDLLSPHEKPERKKKKEKEKEKSGDDAAKNKRGRVRKVLSFAKANKEQVKNSVYSIMNYLFKRFVTIESLKLKMVIGTGDAMETGLLFGSICAFVFTVLGVADKKMKLKKHETDLKPDFDKPHIFAEAEVIIRTSILKALGLIAVMLRRGIPIYIKLRAEKKERGH